MNTAYPATTCSHRARGTLMVTLMVILAALMLLGSLAIAIVVTDRNISRNQRLVKDAFYLADAGHPVAVSIIDAIAYQRAGTPPEISTDPNLKNEVMDYHPDNAALNDKASDSPETSPDIRCSLFDQPLAMDVDRTAATLLGGGSAEFASAGEGSGFGGEGSKKILFTIRSKGCLRAGACSQVISEYRSIW